MRKLLIIGAAIAASLIAGCAGDQQYLKAQADAISAQANARVEEAKAKAEEARAVIAVSAKLDAGGAAGYVLGLAFAHLGGTAAPAAAPAVQRPRDFLDYLQTAGSIFRDVASVGAPIWLGVRQSRDNRDMQMHRDDSQVLLEAARQTGETGRMQSVAAIAADVASRTPQPSITLSGTGVIGSGTYTGPVNTTRNCNGGTAAAGGTGGSGGGTTTGAAGGQAGAGGSAQGGSC